MQHRRNKLQFSVTEIVYKHIYRFNEKALSAYYTILLSNDIVTIFITNGIRYNAPNYINVRGYRRHNTSVNCDQRNEFDWVRTVNDMKNLINFRQDVNIHDFNAKMLIMANQVDTIVTMKIIVYEVSSNKKKKK